MVRASINPWVILALVVSLIGAGCTTSQSPGQFIDDALITSKVESRLSEDDALADATIDVRTENGVVWLSGVVSSKALRKRAATLASSVEGVKKLKLDKLVVVQ